jgi:hypothetical protein
MVWKEEAVAHLWYYTGIFLVGRGYKNYKSIIQESILF